MKSADSGNALHSLNPYKGDGNQFWTSAFGPFPAGGGHENLAVNPTPAQLQLGLCGGQSNRSRPPSEVGKGFTQNRDYLYAER